MNVKLTNDWIELFASEDAPCSVGIDVEFDEYFLYYVENDGVIQHFKTIDQALLSFAKACKSYHPE